MQKKARLRKEPSFREKGLAGKDLVQYLLSLPIRGMERSDFIAETITKTNRSSITIRLLLSTVGTILGRRRDLAD